MDDYREEVKTVMDELLLPIPGVRGGQAFGYPAYKVKGKVFVFVGGAGIAVKLPPERVAALLSEEEAAHPFEPVEGRIWKAWVSLDRADPAAYAADQALFEESIEYILNG
jgi:hypothetical protein